MAEDHGGMIARRFDSTSTKAFGERRAPGKRTDNDLTVSQAHSESAA